MDKEVISKVISALPDEGVDELNTLLDSDFTEQQVLDLFKKYNVNVSEVLFGKENK